LVGEIMINLKNDRMNVRFPEICNKYELNISFQRTLRIPDDGNDHFLPPSLSWVCRSAPLCCLFFML
jgi:hypothetical protein